MKIVATIDFSTTSEAILRVTKTYATKMDAEVFLVHTEPLHADLDQAEYDTKPESIRLKKDARALERARVKVTPVLLRGPVCETIVDEAIRIKADLIITGAHGHGEANCKALVGHISECLLFKSKIPVMVVHG